MKHGVLILGIALGVATAVVAHEGVKDPGVMARMHGMKEIGGASKVLRNMAAQKIPYDMIKAQGAKAALVRHLGEVELLFQQPYTDPKSEALPVIWDDYSKFVDKLVAAQRFAGQLDVRSVDGLRQTLPAAGQGCRDCHKLYRLEK
ncbi:MAG: cytochrome c [Paracoccaceae bacterium]